MNCNNLTGINECVMNVGGIAEVYVFPFNEISQYTYDNDDLNFVTGYSSTTLPVVYKPNQATSELTSIRNGRQIKAYNHTLNLSFPKMDVLKREEIDKLESMDLTIIIKDRNGKCWLMGQDVAARFNQNTATTSTKDGVNGYELVLQSEEKQMLRRIVCPSLGCFSSFTGTESNQTNFIITDAMSRAWEFIETDINGTLVSMDLTQAGQSPLEPTQWNNQTIYNRDYNTVLNLFTSLNNNVSNLVLGWDNLNDEVIIEVTSNDSAFGTFQVDNDVFGRSSYSSVLLLQTVVNTGLQNASTIIEVTNSNSNVVFSTGYGLPITGPGLSGTSNNAVLQMSSLYPNGTTLTVQLANVPCSDVSYTYNYINTLEACSLSRTYNFRKDKRTIIEVACVPYGNQRFQNTTINFNGVNFQLYKNYTDWHDDYTQFVNDVTLLLYQTNLPIDYNSLVFTDYITHVTIEFNVNNSQAVYYYREQTVSFDGELVQNEWNQGRAVTVNTLAPIGSTVTHNDIFGHEMIGQYQNNIISNNFLLLDESFTNNVIDNVSLLWALDDRVPFDANSVLSTSSIGGDCNTSIINDPFDRCYDDFVSIPSNSMQLFTLDASTGSINMGNTFNVTYTDGFTTTVVPFTLPSTVTPNFGVHYFTDAINSIRGLQVLHYDFDIVNRTYRFYITSDGLTNITQIEDVNNFRFFTIGLNEPVHRNETIGSINPYISLVWTLPTDNLSGPTDLKDMRFGQWQTQKVFTTTCQVIWNRSADTLSISKPNGINNQVTVSFHEDYPTSSNAVLFTTLFSGTASDVISSVESKLINNGASLASTNYVAYTNNVGWRIVKSIDLIISGSETVFNEVVEKPVIWGVGDNIYYQGSNPTVTAPTELSGVTSCFSCCSGTYIPDTDDGVTIYADEINGEYRITIQFSDTVSCDVASLYLEIENTNPPEPNPFEIELTERTCENGKLTFRANPDNYVTFVGNPDPSENDVTVTLENSLGQNLGNFEIEWSLNP